MTQPSDVAIVGGGVIGCAAAWYLARAGLRVTVFERGPLGGEATGASAGILAPLAESVSPGPFVELAIAGLHSFTDDIPLLIDESGIDPEYRTEGVLRLAVDAQAADGLRAAAAWQSNARLDLRWLEPRQIASLEPELGANVGGLLSPHEGHIHPARLAASLAAAAAKRGAVFHEYSPPPQPWIAHDRVQGVIVNGERHPAFSVVLAAGAWSAPWAEAVGLTIPVRPVKGQMMLVRMIRKPLRHVVFSGHGYLVPRVDGTIYVGATQEDAGFDKRVTVAGLDELTGYATAILPALAGAEVVRMGAGSRPYSEDGLPVIGSVPNVEGLVVAAGHFRNGILMSLITGRIVTALATGHAPELPLAAFSPARFARG